MASGADYLWAILVKRSRSRNIALQPRHEVAIIANMHGEDMTAEEIAAVLTR